MLSGWEAQKHAARAFWHLAAEGPLRSGGASESSLRALLKLAAAGGRGGASRQLATQALKRLAADPEVFLN